MIESWIADTWLYTVLSTDAQLVAVVGTQIYADVAPIDATYPVVVYSSQANHDVSALGAKRIFNSAVYQVKVIGQVASYGPLRVPANRIEALLHGKSGSTPDGTVISAVRESFVRYSEVDNGLQYRHLGGLYRLQMQSN
jgi:hypothetical protein